ncbi:MAG: zinc dependent phospholipase C family protein [Chloroherpetonaceae bacterium]|nr:zinc dependent phospholipase C family protein [Chloroherpetonaceae bacterium]
MKIKHQRLPIIIFIFAFLLMSFSFLPVVWGFWAHKQIHRLAINRLENVMPASAFNFFRKHEKFLIEHAVDPDDRRRIDPTEGPQHYIDLDRFGKFPFPDLPVRWEDAKQKYGEDSLRANGLVPWRISNFTDSLTLAFQKKDLERILFFAANVGHYVADCNVPLHATENYDGQLTGQNGIHGRWESEYPERFMRHYEARPLPDSLLQYTSFKEIENITEESMKWARESFLLCSPVLKGDLAAQKGLSGDSLKKIVTGREGRKREIYSPFYYEHFKGEMNGMVESRFEISAERVAMIWFTAWVRAGKPDLSNL